MRSFTCKLIFLSVAVVCKLCIGCLCRLMHKMRIPMSFIHCECVWCGEGDSDDAADVGCAINSLRVSLRHHEMLTNCSIDERNVRRTIFLFCALSHVHARCLTAASHHHHWRQPHHVERSHTTNYQKNSPTRWSGPILVTHTRNGVDMFLLRLSYNYYFIICFQHDFLFFDQTFLMSCASIFIV